MDRLSFHSIRFGMPGCMVLNRIGLTHFDLIGFGLTMNSVAFYLIRFELSTFWCE